MTREFIPYEQALELKELGFEEPCFGYWNIDPQLKTPSFNLVRPFEHEWCLPSPLYQQAFRFLNKITDKWLIPIPNDKDKGEWYGVGISYKTFEEAQHACLLRFIELAKQK